MGIGALTTLIIYFFLANGTFQHCKPSLCILAILPGCIWALGMCAVLFAISKEAPISKLAIVYNTNTLVAVVLGVVFLKEALCGAELFRVVIGGLLVTVGIILASWN